MPDFHSAIIACCDNPLAIGIKINRVDPTRMGIDDCCQLTFNSPKSEAVIQSDWSNPLAIGTDLYIFYWRFVAF